MTVIIFLIILAALVFVHELGHFLAAKISGIRVDEFGLGFPPRLFGIKKGETVYSINWIPFGGFVKIFGENPDEESIGGPDKARSFYNKPKSIQAFVLIAGVLFNVIFAWLLISSGFMIGMPVPEGYSATTKVSNPEVTVTSVEKGNPADKAGLKAGDVLVDLKSGSQVLEVASVQDVQDFIAGHPAQAITIDYSRGNRVAKTDVVPQTGIVPGKAAIGISLDEMGILKLSFLRSLWEGLSLTWFVVEATAVGLATFIYQAITGHAQFAQVTGPVGIAGLVGDAARLGIVYLLSFTAYISVNLAVINLIPFPALDGGRLLMTLIEKIKGSAINPKYANTVNAVGFFILITFMLVVTFHDIFNLIHK